MPKSAAKAFQEMFWLACLLLGVLLMISGATEGVSYTSVHIRGENISERSPWSRSFSVFPRRVHRLPHKKEEQIGIDACEPPLFALPRHSGLTASSRALG